MTRWPMSKSQYFLPSANSMTIRRQNTNLGLTFHESFYISLGLFRPINMVFSDFLWLILSVLKSRTWLFMTCYWNLFIKKFCMARLRFEPETFCMLGLCSDHYSTSCLMNLTWLLLGAMKSCWNHLVLKTKSHVETSRDRSVVRKSQW